MLLTVRWAIHCTFWTAAFSISCHRLTRSLTSHKLLHNKQKSLYLKNTQEQSHGRK